jgi:hypothetical protein
LIIFFCHSVLVFVCYCGYFLHLPQADVVIFSNLFLEHVNYYVNIIHKHPLSIVRSFNVPRLVFYFFWNNLWIELTIALTVCLSFRCKLQNNHKLQSISLRSRMSISFPFTSSIPFIMFAKRSSLFIVFFCHEKFYISL